MCTVALIWADMFSLPDCCRIEIRLQHCLAHIIPDCCVRLKQFRRLWCFRLYQGRRNFCYFKAHFVPEGLWGHNSAMATQSTDLLQSQLLLRLHHHQSSPGLEIQPLAFTSTWSSCQESFVPATASFLHKALIRRN